MPLPPLTVDELVSTLTKTSIPTLIVEGVTDASIYRLVERRLNFPGGTVLQAGSRTSVLEVFKRRHEFDHLNVAFLADRDMWLFGAIPDAYADIIFTNGYSIENDLLDGSAIDRLCDADELSEIQNLLMELARWFAFEVEEWRMNRLPQLDIHLNRLIPLNHQALCPQFIQERGFKEADPTIRAEIQKNPKRMIRGKQVLEVLVRTLSRPGRKAKYSKDVIIELCATSPDHKMCEQLILKLQRRMGKTIE